MQINSFLCIGVRNKFCGGLRASAIIFLGLVILEANLLPIEQKYLLNCSALRLLSLVVHPSLNVIEANKFWECFSFVALLIVFQVCLGSLEYTQNKSLQYL